MRTSRPRAIAAAALIGAAFLPACSSDSPTGGESEFSGEYRLETVDEDLLPVIDLIAPLTGDTLYIVGGELQVLSNGRVRIIRESQWRPRNAPAQPVTTDSTERAYREGDGEIYIDHPTGGLAGPYTDTVQLLTNAVEHHALVNRFNLGHFWRDLFYVRQ